MRRIGLMAIGSMLLAACGAENGPGQEQGSGLDAGVASEWELVEGVPTIEGYPITLRIEDGRVGGVAACNSYGGTVEITGGRFAVDELAHTEMGCPEPRVHDSEAAYLTALQAVERYERREGELVLLGPDVELRFEPVTPPEDAELTGTEWQLESLVTGSGPDGAVSSTMAPGWLRLSDDETFTASDGCNEQQGRWSLGDDRVLRLTDVSTTDVACPDFEQQVEHVHDVLMGEPTVEHEGRQLRLTAGDQGLEYRAG